VLKNDTKNVDAWIHKGLALYELGEYEKAIECCDSVLEINPKNSVAWYNKACFESMLGNVDNAISYLKKAIELNKSWIEVC